MELTKTVSQSLKPRGLKGVVRHNNLAWSHAYVHIKTLDLESALLPRLLNFSDGIVLDGLCEGRPRRGVLVLARARKERVCAFRAHVVAFALANGQFSQGQILVWSGSYPARSDPDKLPTWTKSRMTSRSRLLKGQNRSNYPLSDFPPSRTQFC